MAKYFSGITINGNKCGISIIDDNLNIIFMDNLETEKLIELLKRKSVTIISIDAPLSLYQKHSSLIDNQNSDKLVIRRRPCDNILASKQMLTYNSRFIVSRNNLKLLVELSKQLNQLGFSIKKAGEIDKCIIESYPDTSFLSLGFTNNSNMMEEEILKKKTEILKNKGLRIKDLLKKNKKDICAEINTLCQAYTSYLYYSGESTCIGTLEEGLVIIPGKDAFNKSKPAKELQKGVKLSVSNFNHVPKTPVHIPENYSHSVSTISKIKLKTKVIAEYCGAQYLYTNIDGIIRINELRPIKSYRPFTEIYEMKHIKQVQVIIGTTDGLRRVKANLIPNSENSDSFKAAEEEDKKKLDSFWGNHGDKRGYLIKFNKVEVVKA